MTIRRPLLAAAFALLPGTAFAQQNLPPLRGGVDGTYAPHAMPKLGGGVFSARITCEPAGGAQFRLYHRRRSTPARGVTASRR